MPPQTWGCVHRPAEGVPPGCYKLSWALRGRGLLAALHAEDAGAVVPPRYRAEWKPGDGDRNGDAIAAYSLRLADRVGAFLDKQSLVIVLGGDCSILVGNTLALARRGRYGLIFLDAHSDFRHPGNADAIGDVVDCAEMPAADCPEPNGISFANLTTLLRQFLSSPKYAGMELTIYDPDLDADGVVAQRIVHCLREALHP